MTAFTSGTGTGPSSVSGRNSARSAPPWPRSVSRATARPSSAASAIWPLRSRPIAARPVGHILRGATTTPGRASRSAAAPSATSETDVGSVRARRSCRTDRTAPAPGRRPVVELVAQERHPAPVGGDVVEHRLLLTLARLGDPGVAVGVVDPRLAGGGPPAADAAYGTVDVEHLEHRLEAGARELDPGLERGGAHRPALLGQHLEGLADQLLAREGQRGEVGPDVTVLGGREQHHGRLVDAAPGAARPAGSRPPATVAHRG